MTEQWTAEEYRNYVNGKLKAGDKATGYAQSTEVDGIKFDSKGEANRYRYWKLELEAGEIAGIERQVSFKFNAGFRWTADFVIYQKDGTSFIDEYKGFERERWKMIKKLLASEKPHLTVYVTTQKRTTLLQKGIGYAV